MLANADPGPPVIPGTGFAPEDVSVMTFNKMTGETATITIAAGGITHDPADATNPWAMFDVALPGDGITAVADIGEGYTVLVTIAKGAAENADPADVIKAGTGDDTLGKNDKGSLQFDVVPAAEIN